MLAARVRCARVGRARRTRRFPAAHGTDQSGVRVSRRSPRAGDGRRVGSFQGRGRMSPAWGPPKDGRPVGLRRWKYLSIDAFGPPCLPSREPRTTPRDGNAQRIRRPMRVLARRTASSARCRPRLHSSASVGLICRHSSRTFSKRSAATVSSGDIEASTRSAAALVAIRQRQCAA